GIKVANEFGLNSLEKEYFVDLIHLGRASDLATKDFYSDQIAKKRERFLNLSERIKTQKVLDQKDQAKFYSHWYYLGIQILTSMEGYQKPETIAEALKIPIQKVMEALDFLVQMGLCVFDGNAYTLGTSKTYVGRDSPLVARHHTNWRLRTMQQFQD